MSGEQPRRVQLRRAKGWRMPANTVSVARPTKWRNPFRVPSTVVPSGRYEWSFAINDREGAVAAFRRMVADKREAERCYPTNAELDELRGKNLACWCPLDQPCHADVLLELANADTPTQVNGGDR